MWQHTGRSSCVSTPRSVLVRTHFKSKKKWHWSFLIFHCGERETVVDLKSLPAVVGKGVYWKQRLLFLSLQTAFSMLSSSNEDCHRTLRHFVQLSLKWLNSWFSLTVCAQIHRCLSWKCAHSSVILVFISQEMAASLIFFCSVTEIRKHEILDGGEILKDSWIMNFRFGFLRKALPSAVLLKLCAVMTPGLEECSSTEKRAREEPVFYLRSLPSSLGDVEVWITTAAALDSSQHHLMPQALNAKELSR